MKGAISKVTPIFTSLSVLLLLARCDIDPYSHRVDHDTELAWQKNFNEALLEGYTDFKGWFVDVDIGVFIFSYRYSSAVTKDSREAFEQLKKQIQGFEVYSEGSDELVLRQKTKSFPFEGFDEYRVLIDSQRRKITVMFANLDNPYEGKGIPDLIKRQRTYHSK